MFDIFSQTNQSNPYLDCDFDAPLVIGNIDRLPMNLTLDNTPYAPCAYLVAQDINPADGSWASRHDVSKTLSVAGAGAAPTYGNYSAIENTAVKYNAAKYHQAANTTWGQATTGDFAVECIYNGTTSTVVLFGTRATGGAPNQGLRCYFSASGLIFNFVDLSATNISLSGAAISGSGIQHMMVFVDRSDKAYLYINGVYNAVSASTSTLSGDLTGSALTVADYPGGAASFDSSVISFSMWDLPSNPFPGVLKNRTYFDRIARERFAIISGIEDQRKGAHSFTRATSAYLDKYISTTERRLFKVSAGWPRVCERKDANSLYVKGFLSEPANQNKCVQSEDLATTWTATNITSVSANAIAAPTGNLTADGLVGDADNDVHDVYQAITCAASAHCFSVFAKKGNKDWIELYSNTTNVTCYFNLATGAVGTAGAGVTASGIESFGNDWYRPYVIFTGSASAQNFHLRSAHADTDNTFAGDATTVNTYFWGAQVEAVTEYFPSSYIPTVAGAVTRNKDELFYNIKLPIVGNINDLSQSLNIGGTDYAPCAYLVADDCQADGTWTSRHGAKSLAFSGAGTNPTPNWSAVSRANRSVKYWGSNFHKITDATAGQITTGDFAIECITKTSALDGVLVSTRNGAPDIGFSVLLYLNKVYINIGDGTYASSCVSAEALSAVALTHVFICSDRSEKVYIFINGVYSASIDTSAVTGSIITAAFAVGNYAVAGRPHDEEVAHAAVWDLPTNPWPGAATNQAVMAAIARARFNQLFRYESCRLDCDILHPNVDAQTARIFVTAGNSANDYSYLGVGTNDYGLAKAVANAATQWDASTTVGAQDICDNVKIKLSTKARVNLASYVEDNITIASDTTCELPAGQAKVWVGELYDGTIQPACLVSNVKLSRNDRR